MLKTANRTSQRFDAINRLGQEEFTSGKIVPSRVRTMFSIPIVVLPGLDAPAFPLDLSTGLGVFFAIRRFYLWKPPGSAYIGTPGNVRLSFSNAAVTPFNFAYTAFLTSNNAHVFHAMDFGALGVTGADKYDLSFSTGNVTGDGPPLYYACFFTRYNLTCPLQLS